MKFYKSIKLTCLASILAAGVSYAGAPCNGFAIKIKNNLPEALILNKVNLVGANLQPGSLDRIAANAEATFVVNNVSQKLLNGQLVFVPERLPLRKIEVAFDLKNGLLMCKHSDKTNKPAEGYPISKARNYSGVTYTINGF